MATNSARWNEYALAFDRAVQQLLPYHEMLRDVINACGSRAQNPRILDAGCGSGNLLLKLIEEYVGSTIAGIDFSDAMLAIARLKTKGKVQLAKADLTLPATPDSQGAYDVVTCVNVLYALDAAQRKAAIATLKSYIRKRGILVVVVPCADASILRVIGSHIKQGGIVRAFPAVKSILAALLGFAKIVFQVKSGSYTYFSEEQLRAELAEAGTVVSVEKTYANQNYLARVIVG